MSRLEPRPPIPANSKEGHVSAGASTSHSSEFEGGHVSAGASTSHSSEFEGGSSLGLSLDLPFP
jgi:hypothetical protein